MSSRSFGLSIVRVISWMGGNNADIGESNWGLQNAFVVSGSKHPVNFKLLCGAPTEVRLGDCDVGISDLVKA